MKTCPFQVVVISLIITTISHVIITTHGAKKSQPEEKDGEDWEETQGICFDDTAPDFDRITVKRTLARCKLACVREREFLCLSVEWDMRDHFCNLTRHSTETRKPIKPCDPRYVILYERLDPPVAFVPAKPGSYDEDMYNKWIAPKSKPVPKELVDTWEVDVDELKDKLTKMKKDKEKADKKKSKKKGTKKKDDTEKDNKSSKTKDSETSVEYDPDEVLKNLMPDGVVNTGFMKSKYKIKRTMPKEEL